MRIANKYLPSAAYVFVIVIVACSHPLYADALQGSAVSTGVSISLTLSSGTFSGSGILQASATVSAGAQSQTTSHLGTISLPASAGPLLINDTPTVSTAQAASNVAGSLTNSGKTFGVFTSSSASASSAFVATAEGDSGADRGVGLPRFSQPTSATFDIDLMSDFGSNPAAAYSVQTSATGPNIPSTHYSDVTLVTSIRSNIPGLAALLDLGLEETLQNGLRTFTMGFSSPLIPQPIFASDFIAGPNGTYSLDPNKRHISIPFTIPANASYQFTVSTGTAVQIVPEPSTISLAGIGLALIGAFHARRTRRWPRLLN